jgi:hypothetical protein
MLLKNRLRRLRSQLLLIFLVGFPGLGLAIGIPVILLISQQSSSHAQKLLEQAVVASRAFMRREQSDLQSLALLISQRPTLTRLLNQQDLPALEEYLNTLRESANLDLILICSGENAVASVDKDLASPDLCRLAAQSGYAAGSSADGLVLYATGEVSPDQAYKVLIAKRASSILTELQRETGLLSFLFWQHQVVPASDTPVAVSPDLANRLLQGAGQDSSRFLSQPTFNINEHRYLLSNQEIDPDLRLSLVSALNVDDQIEVQQNLSSTLLFGLFFIVLIASVAGIWLSERISEPIVRLAHAAGKFRQGNLASPISIQSPIWEIDHLANTLEDGRIALQHSLQQLQAE